MALMGLFVVSLVWRLLYLRRLAASPLFGTLRGDERLYWDWASFLLGHGFQATHPFFMGPLYPYVLALVRECVGSHVLPVLIVQSTWGALACVLIADAARAWVRSSIALGLGIALGLYEMAVLFDGLVLMESLLFFLEAALLWVWSRSVARGAGLGWMAVVGLVTGLIAECRATGALMLLPGIAIAWGSAGSSRGLRTARLSAMLASFLLVIAPAALWNWSRTREFIPFTYNAGFNLLIGNNPRSDGTFVWLPGMNRFGSPKAEDLDGGVEGDGREYLAKTRGVVLSPARSSEYWTRQALTFIGERPGTTIRLAGKKLLLMLNHAEVPQIETAELFRRLAGPLGLPWVGSFWTIGTLGLVGLVIARRWGLMGTLLRLYVLVLLLGTLPFFVTDRYRFHLVPALALLAAMTVEIALQSVRTRAVADRRVLWAGAAAVVVVALPLTRANPGFDEWVVSQDLGTRWLEQGRPDLAVREFDHALQLERPLALAEDPDPDLGERRARLYFNYGAALRKTGQEDAALRWLTAAAELDPTNAHYLRTLGDAYRVHGRVREGDSLLARVRSLVGGEGEALLSEGYQMAREGRLEEAERLFQSATHEDTRLSGAWGALIRIQVQRGAIERARLTLKEAANTPVPPHVLGVYEALVAAASGDSAGAEAALRRIPSEAITSDPTLVRVVRWTRDLLRPQGR